MKRHPADLASLVPGLIVASVAIAVMLRRTPSLIGGGAWWLAVAAIAFGLALIPWRGATPPAVPDELCQTDLVRDRDASTRSDT